MDKDRLRELWHEIDGRLARLDFEAVWPGFSPVDFALYTPGIMCFKGRISEKPSSFFGNTAIDYGGACIAIWNMSYTTIGDGDSLNRLTASLVHEMFHAFQRRQGESRFAKDLELLLYPRDPALIAWTVRESEILAEAVLYQGEDQKERSLETLGLMAAIRAAKTQLSDGATVNEYRVETTEGLAEYAGYRSLFQIDEDLAAQQLCRYAEELLNPDYLFDIRRRSYFSGVLLAVTAGRAGLPIVHDLSESRNFWDLLEIPLDPVEALSPRELSRAAGLVGDQNQRRADLLAGFLDRFPGKRPVQALIVGYDPMNLERIDDYLISTHLLMTEEDGVKTTHTGDHLFLMKAGDPRQVEAVFLE